VVSTPGPGPIMDEPRLFTAAQRRAIARSREARRIKLAPLHAEIEAAIADVGWRRARPVIQSVLEPLHVAGRRGRWWERVGVRAGSRILAELREMPCQGRLPFGPSGRRPK
jgi:hypothetical protein